MDANRAAREYRLESELARVGLHAAERDADRKVAWVNSICILFLLIGVVGSRPATIRIKPLPPSSEVNAAIVEPLPPPPQPPPDAQQQQEQTSDSAPDTPQVVVVTQPSPSINFAIPTVGNLLVPAAIAQAPPRVELKPVTPLRREPTVIKSTGGSGERPQPPYPKIALEQGQQGSVTLRLRVDDAGAIEEIEVAQSSGFPLLDRSAQDFVKRHWTVPAGKGARVYEATIHYKLQVD